MQYKNKDDDVFKSEYKKKRYLFQGNSCFPLSPCDANDSKDKDPETGKQNVHVISKTD